MPKRKSIISFDLDMTLLDHSGYQVPDSAMEALRRLRKHHKIVIASGRDMDGHYSRQFKELLQPDGIIHSNGTKVTADSQLIYRYEMPRELLGELLSFARDKGLSLGATIGDLDYYTSPEAVTAHDRRRWGEINRQFRDPFQLLEFPVGTLAYIGDESGVKLLEKQFPQVKFPMFGGNMGADVIQRSVSKADGLMRLCCFWDIDPKHTAAFGDSMNDLEILKAAGIGIAMGNGLARLKEQADYITAAIDEDGVYKACEHFHWFMGFYE